MKTLSILFMVLLFTACQQNSEQADSKIASKPTKPHVLSGLWRGVLASPGGELPFGIDISKDNEIYTAHIINGQERGETSSVILTGDQISINFDWFDARINATLDSDGNGMQGQWSKTASGKDKKSSLPFSAQRGYNFRFSHQNNEVKSPNINGNWQVVFTDEDGTDKAVAELSQNNQIVSGTFLTPTGDYRYLSGNINNNKLFLSTFDGAHAFLFDAQIKGDKLVNGNFWSRDSYHATWEGIFSEDTSDYLPSAWQMNNITTKDNSVSFSFEDTMGNRVQLTDEKFSGKPVLINLFGTWCPNCNDEAPVLAEFYRKYNSQGLEIVGLAFEFTEDPERDKKQIDIFRDRHAIDYPLLLAGGNDKGEATKILGFLDQVKSYPTTIFLDKNHQVTNIFTGFSGPGTGQHYIDLVEELEAEIKKLL